METAGCEDSQAFVSMSYFHSFSLLPWFFEENLDQPHQ